MTQVTAEIISNKQILKELERRDAYTSKRPEARNVSSSWIIWLNCPDIAAEARPGQFVMVRCGDDCYLPRPFSIHRVNQEGIALFFNVWKDGKGTGWLSRRRKGDRIKLFGQPLGKGFSIKATARKLLLVAGGTGIAPLCFLAEQNQSKYSVKLLRGASGEYKPSGKPNPSQHYPKRLLPHGIEVDTITSSPDGREGMVIDLLTPDIIDWADQIFACGPVGMYQTMATLSKQHPKLKTAQISLEIMMGCGVGVCYGCTVKTRSGLKQVCKDGPVFELEDIIWEELKG